MTITTATRPRRTWWQFAGYLARHAILLELHGYQSIYRFVFRRPRVPPGAVGFSYSQTILSILIVIHRRVDPGDGGGRPDCAAMDLPTGAAARPEHLGVG